MEKLIILFIKVRTELDVKELEDEADRFLKGHTERLLHFFSQAMIDGDCKVLEL
jgi:hypothetical protein